MRCTLLAPWLAMLSPDLIAQAPDEMVSAALPGSGWEQALTTISIADQSRGATMIRNRELMAASAHSKISGPVAAHLGTRHLRARHSDLRAYRRGCADMPTTLPIGNARRRRTRGRVLTLSFLVMLALGRIALTLAIGPQGAPGEFGLTEQSQTRM